MQLSLNRPEEYLFIRNCRADAITVVDRELHASFILSAERAIEDWPVRTVGELDEKNIAAILELKPEVVLLGTGARIVFPSQAILAQFLQRGIGIEVMDNAAASRTFNVLVSEGRRAVAAFFL
ncbi:hypothetical protein ELE36_13880 [Pseudolysobacter antarcticus]|uniref:Xcc1710-like domain-containing protein n=1 Tax=Pseudolysobacter antarcticus TaxID=2511995 RepID=A0A411HLH7_9GAMM|nr:MTH938/NDUFAF3 family protein [Pseudolysobacter antarcticus]QBB71353.1 hypothetical protein ELE36_13880 [Pseudolysobacter antarcticus]